MGIWNIREMRGKAQEIVEELNKVKADIVVLTEIKRKGNGIEKIGKYIHIYSEVKKDERAKREVLVLIHKKHKKNIASWEAINDRIITININKGNRITVVGVYGPNEDAKVEEKERHGEILEGVISQIGQSREVLILEDMNARVGRRRNHKVIGQFGEEVLNNNGERLIDFCQQNSLKIMSGYFKHKRIDLHMETRNKKSQIDY